MHHMEVKSEKAKGKRTREKLKDSFIFYPVSFSFFLFTFAFLFGCTHDQGNMKKIILIAGDIEVPVLVEIADDPDEQQVGLMNRTELPENQGMLFLFSQPQILSFWMKNTLIPLDVLFFDAEGNFAGVRTMDPCKKDPCTVYSSDTVATFALELSSGFYERKLLPHLKKQGVVLQLRFPEE